mmetsp:Transcript_18033/g.36707  ORF Transcript_18033/g.36707 Transcript_18033/m.36707 type:complete len:274 (+) Transcript_18033:148-969(+)
MGCATSKNPVEVESEGDGPVVRLIKVDDLLSNAILGDRDLLLTSEDILQQHWTAKKSIDGLFGPCSFKLVPWRQLKSTKYGVLTYSWGNREKRIWGATWAGMIQALKSKKKLNVKYAWIDIFCLDQNDPKKMETIRRSDKIYAWANQYHVMGMGTFNRGWCLMELGVTKATPILYSGGDGLRDDAQDIMEILWKVNEGEKRAGLHQLFRFEAAGFSVESDRDIVRGFIQSARGDVARFEAFLVEKVLSDRAVLVFADLFSMEDFSSRPWNDMI